MAMDRKKTPRTNRYATFGFAKSLPHLIEMHRADKHLSDQWSYPAASGDVGLGLQHPPFGLHP